jgi:hypothetical protein
MLNFKNVLELEWQPIYVVGSSDMRLYLKYHDDEGVMLTGSPELTFIQDSPVYSVNSTDQARRICNEVNALQSARWYLWEREHEDDSFPTSIPMTVIRLDRRLVITPSLAPPAAP